MNSVLNEYKNRFPHRAFATNDLNQGLYMRQAAEALLMRLAQHNAKNSAAWLVYDMDTSTASTDWIDADCPPPNILSVNPANGHAHLFYGLEVPVHLNDTSSRKAIRYLGAVDIALTQKLGADPGYAKLISKNPLNESWITVFPYTELYTLDQLAQGLELDRLLDGRKRQPATGYGRNCTLFDTVRQWAYTEIRRPQMYLSADMFIEACRWKALQVNAEFPQPLPHSEVRSVAKSIGRWVWSNMDAQGFREWGDKRRAQSMKVRKTRAFETRQKILQAREECPELTQADIAAMIGVTSRTVRTHLRIFKESGNL
jgi:hypothetical protein